MTTITRLSKKLKLSYSETLAKVSILEDAGFSDLRLLIYHGCNKEPVDSLDYGLSFPNLPYTCPCCKSQINNYDLMGFDIDVSPLTTQQWRELLDKEPLAIHAPLVESQKKRPPHESKFNVGDLVVNRQFPYEVSRIIEIDEGAVKIQHPYGVEWVLDSDLRFILRWHEGFYPYTNLLEFCQDELDF